MIEWVIEKGVGFRNSGVVHENVASSEPTFDFPETAFDRSLVADVQGHGRRRALLRLYRFGGLRRGFEVEVRDDDTMAGCRELRCDRRSDGGGATRNEGRSGVRGLRHRPQGWRDRPHALCWWHAPAVLPPSRA